jgi:hypothetical protein
MRLSEKERGMTKPETALRWMLCNLWWAIKEPFCDQQKDIARYRDSIEKQIEEKPFEDHHVEIYK